MKDRKNDATFFPTKWKKGYFFRRRLKRVAFVITSAGIGEKVGKYPDACPVKTMLEDAMPDGECKW
ncbi:hypothetical protein SIN01_11780 [Sporolactobacillus inulinus]|nr:hypothetical protein SIN01_11780 [Sporolactobacillus inulinus]